MSDFVPVPEPRFTLRDLTLPARLTLAVFLCSVGIGYVAALVNLHFQSASAGSLLPTADDSERIFRGGQAQDLDRLLDEPAGGGRRDEAADEELVRSPHRSQLQRLLEAPETLPFNGQGSMRAALTQRKSSGFDTAVRRKAEKMGLDPDKAADRKKVRQEVEKDLEGERLALIQWLCNTRPAEKKKAYEADAYPLPPGSDKLQITEKFKKKNDQGAWVVKVKSILDARCARCHKDGGDAAAEFYPLTDWDEIKPYTDPTPPTGMSLPKLALTTHLHLLGFSVLYVLTGVIFALTSYPGVIRFVLAPLPLLAQVVDIAFWWLARLDPPEGVMFARWIPITGAVVACAVLLQIILGLFGLFRAKGKVVIVLLLVLAGALGYFVKNHYIDPYLASERGLVESLK
jgi:hypothetical protein